MESIKPVKHVKMFSQYYARWGHSICRYSDDLILPHRVQDIDNAMRGIGIICIVPRGGGGGGGGDFKWLNYKHNLCIAILSTK